MLRHIYKIYARFVYYTISLLLLTAYQVQTLFCIIQKKILKNKMKTKKYRL